jgi:hypothetical protein
MKQVSNAPNSLVVSSTHYSSKHRFFKYLSIFLPAFLLFIISSCKKDAFQDGNQNSEISSNAQKSDRKLKTVPFKASFITMDEMTQAASDANPIQKDHLTGTGVGTEIGRASIEVFVEGDVTLPFPALVTSTATFTAANGDKIFERGEGYLQEPAPDAVLLHLNGNGTIIGGTGRFAGATGNLSVEVTQNFFDLKGTVVFTGTICYAAGQN